MPHYPKPFFREARGLWYVQVDGKQINLGADREAAFCQYHQLMQPPQNATSTASVSVASIVDAFLDWSQKHRALRTHRRYLEYCQSFVEMFPDLLVAELKPFHVQEWVDSHEGWGNTTKRSAVTAMKRTFNWAEKQGRVAATPIRHAEMPPPTAGWLPRTGRSGRSRYVASRTRRRTYTMGDFSPWKTRWSSSTSFWNYDSPLRRRKIWRHSCELCRCVMYYLYGKKPDVDRKLVATFDTEAQLLAYVGWATLKTNADGSRKFEQGSALVGYPRFDDSSEPLTDEDESEVLHNPTPSML